MQPSGHHLAELNFGTLKHDWDDPRVKGFVDGLDLVNGLAARSPGFLWRLSDEDMGAAQTDPKDAFGDNPRIASTLSVWEDAASLDQFVWNTLHRQFYARRAEWYDAVGQSHMIFWWVPVGHRPDVSEGMARFRHHSENGDTAYAFGWAYVEAAKLWRTKNCNAMMAE